MMWKTWTLLAVISVVWAGKISSHKPHVTHDFHIVHDYDYDKHHKNMEHHKEEIEEKPKEEQAAQTEGVNEEEQNEEANNEPENENESENSNTESEEAKSDEDEYKGYEFFYKVMDPHTHDKKGQHEKKHEGQVNGVYWLLQPDGYKRTVDYHTDKHNGFHAKVEYTKSEEHVNEEDHSKPKSEYYVKTYHNDKYIPITEEQEEEQDRQEESAEHVPIYVI